jgi:hypothetical protein
MDRFVLQGTQTALEKGRENSSFTIQTSLTSPSNFWDYTKWINAMSKFSTIFVPFMDEQKI